MGIETYSTDPDANTSVSGIDISEGCDAKWFNNALRQFMADMARFYQTYVAIVFPLSIAKGGTGALDAPSALAALGGLGLAYRHLPQTTKAAGFTLDLTLDGGHVYFTGAAATAAIPLNATVAFALGTVIVIVNDGSGALAIARTGGVALKWAQTGANADRSLAVGAMATLVKVATDLWFISGAGLS